MDYNLHLPRWARASVFTARTFLAILTATPGTIIAADAIYNAVNPSIVYADSPTGKISEIQRVGDCRWDITVEVTGLRPGANLKATNYYDFSDCQGNHRSGSYGPYNLGVADNSGRNITVHPQSDFGSYIKIITDSEGNQLNITYSYGPNYTSQTPVSYTTTQTQPSTKTPSQVTTPDANATKIAGLQTAIADQEKKNAENTVIANLGKKATALKQSPTNTPIPAATATPAPVLAPADKEATTEARLDEAFNKEKARLQEEYERKNPRSTVTHVPVDVSATAEARRIDALGKRQAEIKGTATAEANATATARADTIRLKALGEEQAEIKGTATAEANPAATAAARATMNEASARYRGSLQATATEQAKPPSIETPKSNTTSVPGSQPGGSGSGDSEGGFPWREIGSSLLAAAAFLVYRRGKNSKRVGTGATAGTAASTGSSTSTTPGTGGIPGAGGPPNPNTAPSTGPAQPKDPEWITGQQEFERKWQAAKSKLLPIRPGDSGDQYEYVLDRFKAGMSIVHKVSLNDAIRVLMMATRVRAGIEYLIPEIWSDNNRILKIKRFFDPGFNAGYLTVEDMAKIIYLPEQYRTLSGFNEAQTKDVRRIHRIFATALHPDTSKSDADPNLQDPIDELLKRFNPAWTYIDRLIK